jgi:type I restriction-modification system DNA methylase subunit
MSKQYICELCNKIFNQKNDYKRHQMKKTPCISLSEIQHNIETTNTVINDTTNITNMFKQCLNVLRDNEGITGEKALKNLSYLLILKLIEPHFNNGVIDIDNYEYDTDNNVTKLLELTRFTNILNIPEEEILSSLNCVWYDILSIHPITKQIFPIGKEFDITLNITFKRIFNILNSLPNTSVDILGNAYEEVIQHIMTGKTLGQFFTQPLIKNMMVKLIDPQIHLDGTIETCGDPTMGTGGFLITYLQYILKQAHLKNIQPDWEFIKTDGLYGKEIDVDTYQLAVSNMLISSGHMFEQLEKGDSIRVPIERKFDNILANPPFGIKGLNYNNFNSPLKMEYVPIKTDNAVSLFIQAIIYMLKINGKCAVLLPAGQDLFSKTNKTLIAIREYLIKTCDLKEIYYLPPDVFANTAIKTCVFYFIKKREGTDVLTTDIKISPTTQKETGRYYKFTKTHKTTQIKFYDYNPHEEIKNLLVEVPIEQLAENSYSLNYTDYIEDEIEESYDDGVIVKTLGELCIFMPKSKRKASYGVKNGNYNFYTSSQLCTKKCDISDYTVNSLIIGTGGVANIKYDNNYSCSADNYVLTAKNDNTKYIYYYLLNNIKLLENGFIGATIKHISQKYIKSIKIPIPSLENQQDIVNQLDFINDECIKTSEIKIKQLNKLNKLYLNNQKLYGAVFTLGEVCTVKQGTYITKTIKIPGEYPVYGGGGISYYINQYNRENEIIIAKDGVSNKCVRYEKSKFFLNHHAWTLNCNDNVLKLYLYYYLLSIQDILLSIATGAAQLGINQANFFKLTIPIPSLEKQQEIVNYCENNDNLIKQLEEEIESNKLLAKEYIFNITQNMINNDTNEIVHTISDDDTSITDESINGVTTKVSNLSIVPTEESNSDSDSD